ncbi:MAG TPA: TRAP transporter substrate-binding protein [Methylomirabilota bacterium]
MVSRLPALIVVLAVAAVLALPGAAAAQRKFSFGYDQPHTTAYGIAADLFDAKLQQMSGGKLAINQFPGAQLGQEPVMLQKLRAGDIDFIITSTANAASVAPEAGVFSLHFIFRDDEHLKKAIADPKVVDAFRGMIKDSVQGAHVMALMTMGFRNMYSKKEIKSLEDIKGMKVRVQATKTEDTHFPAYGAQTVHMPFGEVYTSLQTGVVNVAENGVNVYLANKHYEVAPIMSMTQHEANNNAVWVSEKTWNSLSDQEKQWVQAAADEIGRVEPAKALALEQESAVKLKSMGVKIVDGVDKSGFMKAAQPIQDQLAKELGPHAVKILQLVREVK